MSNNDKYPSVENKETLQKLSQDIKPDDVKFLLSLNSDISIDECRDNAMESVKALNAYITSGHSIDKKSGLSLTSVRRSMSI